MTTILLPLWSAAQKRTKLKQSKLQFTLKQVKFMGNVITGQAMQADPDKIAAILAMAPPRTEQVYRDSWEWPIISHAIVATSAPSSDLSPNSPSQIPVLVGTSTR